MIDEITIEHPIDPISDMELAIRSHADAVEFTIRNTVDAPCGYIRSYGVESAELGKRVRHTPGYYDAGNGNLASQVIHSTIEDM